MNVTCEVCKLPIEFFESTEQKLKDKFGKDTPVEHYHADTCYDNRNVPA